MTSGVVFDIGGVVCRYRPDRRLQVLSDATGLAPDLIDARVFGSGLEDEAERGAIALPDLERAIDEALGLRLDATALGAAWSSAFEPDPAVLAVVRRVDGLRFAFTNNGPLFRSCLDDTLATVRAAFDRVVCSCELGARKPDPEAFRRLSAALGVALDELVFVDDDADHCAGARSVGMTVVPFGSLEQVERDLEAAGLLR